MPRVIVLVGLPGSGKSSIAKAIKLLGRNYTHISQDELGSFEKCQTAFNKAISSGMTAIIDRCNVTRSDRAIWITDKSTWIVHLNIALKHCIYHAQHRLAHPTLKAEKVESAVKSFNDRFEPPSIDEFKNSSTGKLITLNSFGEINDFIKAIDKSGSSSWFVKFPRTRHFANLGSVSRDDLLLTSAEQKNFLGLGLGLSSEIYVEEKIDGANIGISVENFKFVVQNRGHVVYSTTMEQFKPLDKWLEKHYEELWDLLADGKLILFGEWMYARHGIAYDKLPDYFIAFDIYDRDTGRFYSRERLEEKLSRTSICVVPLITRGYFKRVTDLTELVNTKSSYYDGPVEGVYLRINSKSWLKDRAKIVRSDFFPVNEDAVHWTRGKFELNKLD